MTGLDKIWRDRDLSVHLKTRLVKTLVFPVAMYGCEKTGVTKDGSFEMWCWRHMLRVRNIRMNQFVRFEPGRGGWMRCKR